MTDKLVVLAGPCLGEQEWLELDAFTRACGVTEAFVRELVAEGLVAAPAQPWRFAGEDLARVRRICRLQRDFDASLASVAVMLDLLDEVERLRRVLARAGLSG